MKRKGACLLFVLFLFLIGSLMANDDYVARKQAMLDSGAEKIHTTLSNDSIAIHVDTETGQFNVGTLPDSTTLIFHFPYSPGTSNTVFNIDNTSTCDYVNETFAATWASSIMDYASSSIPFTTYSASGDSSYIEGGWVVDNVRFVQKVQPVYLERPDGKIAGSCFVQYRVTNLGSVTHQVGVRLQMDTMINNNDAARVSTIYGYSNEEQVFNDPLIPSNYSAYEETLSTGEPDPTSLKATGYLSPDPVAPDCVTPDAFALGSWPTFNDLSSWRYSSPGGSYWDSAVLVLWEGTVAPGDSVVFGTYYGIGIPDFTPPTAEPVVPSNGIWTACAGTDIALKIRDEESVNENSIQLEVNGDVYTTSDAELTWLPTDSLLIFTPSSSFSNGSTVSVSLLDVSDMEGNSLEEPVNWSFMVDDIGAAITAMSPNGVNAPSLSPTLSCNIFDYESGVDPSTIEIEVDGVTYNMSTPGMNYDAVSGDFTFDMATAGVVFSTGQTIDVQIVKADDSPDTCEPHFPQAHTWSFTTSIPPIPILVSPPESVITTCEDQKILIDLTSGENIDPSTITLHVDANVFTIDDDDLYLLNDTLYFDPSAAFTYNTGLVTVCIDPVADSMGAYSDSACWAFYVDLVPPVMANESPVSPPVVTEFDFDISVDLSDNMLPIDSSNIELMIINNENRDTAVVTYDSSFATWSNPTFSFPANMANVSFNDGEVVTVIVRVRDLPPPIPAPLEACAGNLLDTTFTFEIAATPCSRMPNPITPGISAGINDEVIFEFPNMRKADLPVHIYIFDLRNNQVADISAPVSGEWRWDGTDTNRQQLGQGTYIYMIEVDGEVECTGTISIAR